MKSECKKDSIAKKEILNVSEQLFKEYGYDHTTYKMIGEKLGITRGAIVYHFKNKHRILHTLFENYFNSLHEYIQNNLTEHFNYYLYYCIFYIYLSKEITKSEKNYQLFYHKDYMESWENEKILDVEKSYRLITDNFNKDFTDEELRLATIMDLGARTNLFKEFSEGDGTLTIDKYSYYRVYLIGVLSRLDEATIQKNIKWAFEFVDANELESIHLLA